MPKTPSVANANGLTYRQSGVDITAGEALVKAIRPLAAATRRAGADVDLGGFGGLFDLKAAGLSDPVLVAATDGVGTKLKLAIATGHHDTVGIDLVAMCVNDIVAQGAEPLFFLDYFATGHLDTAIATKVVGGIAEGCRIAGCALIGGETAEMPGMYEADHYDLAGFAVGAVERSGILPRSDVVPGDVLIGLASSGVHSNGFSLVRKIVDENGLDLEAEADFAAQQSLGEALLAPTRIYVRPLLAAIAKTGAVKALAHITGGGITHNLPRVLPANTTARVDLSALPRLDAMGWLAREGGIAIEEMLTTFNCGVGMVAVVEHAAAGSLLSALEQSGETAFRLGEIVAGDGEPTVEYSGQAWWMV